MIDYYRFPERRNIWGGAFNGQRFRIKIFHELVEILTPDFIVETGTHRGSTTEYLANIYKIPIYTVELEKRTYGFSVMRLKTYSNVKLHLGDSNSFLKGLLDSPEARAKQGLYYLDSHWKDELPIKNELQLIFSKNISSVVMIDDFKVPDDPGYGFDNYGYREALTLEYIEEILDEFNLHVFLPKCRSSDEDGSRRGCVVLADSKNAKLLSGLITIRAWNSVTEKVSI